MPEYRVRCSLWLTIGEADRLHDLHAWPAGILGASAKEPGNPKDAARIVVEFSLSSALAKELRKDDRALPARLAQYLGVEFYYPQKEDKPSKAGVRRKSKAERILSALVVLGSMFADGRVPVKALQEACNIKSRTSMNSAINGLNGRVEHHAGRGRHDLPWVRLI